LDSGFESTRNTFYQTMIGLTYKSDESCPADLFSQSCVEGFLQAQWESFGYPFAQVFELHVLQEIAALEEVDLVDLNELCYGSTPEICRLKELVNGIDDYSTTKAVNVAAALISISRFDLAERCLRSTDKRNVNKREVFEIGMLEFVIANRRDNGIGSAAAFRKMRVAIEEGRLPAERMLGACSQAVVWYLKKKDLASSDYKWFRSLGERLTQRNRQMDPSAISSWYRAVAMLPASKGDRVLTREYMLHARDAAERSISMRPRAYEMHLLKTYHESVLKEHMYVTHDLDQAVAAGRALIDLDPCWSVSYGELAEAYQKYGHYDEAAVLYEQSAEIGPPYVGHHLFQAAQCYSLLGDDEYALALYLRLYDFNPTNRSVILAGLKSSLRCRHSATERFSAAFDKLQPAPEPREVEWLQNA
jgi:hypothetical protein